MGITILVVEDYEDTRTLVKFHLEMCGYTVKEAANGREAIESVEQQCPHLILMDMSLPEIDGLTATRAIHEMEKACAVPIVAVTAHSGPEYRAKAFAAGCTDFVSKPIDFDKLEAVIQNHLGLSTQ